MGYGVFLCILGAPWLVLALLVYLLTYRTPGNEGVPIAGHALWAEVGGGIVCVTLGEFTGLHESAPCVFRLMDYVMPYVLAFPRQPSLQDYYACYGILD